MLVFVFGAVAGGAITLCVLGVLATWYPFHAPSPVHQVTCEQPVLLPDRDERELRYARLQAVALKKGYQIVKASSSLVDTYELWSLFHEMRVRPVLSGTTLDAIAQFLEVAPTNK